MLENISDAALVEQLIKSYSQQLHWYGQLKKIVDSMLSHLVLSRGDITSMVPALEKKKDLIEIIGQERERIDTLVTTWHTRKNSIGRTESVDRFNGLLEQTEEKIKEFLTVEEQIKKYFEHLTSSQNNGTEKNGEPNQ